MPVDGLAFRDPQVVPFSPDVEAAARFYGSLGFVERFRTPSQGEPIHVDVELSGCRIGIASIASTRDDHGLHPVDHGERAAVVLWTDDVHAALARLRSAGVAVLREPEPWLGRLLIAWVADPDGHPIQLVQSLGPA
jgi:catechol 2,3-dioxygenase-like lactoylglutathione lyase family enzyme